MHCAVQLSECFRFKSEANNFYGISVLVSWILTHQSPIVIQVCVSELELPCSPDLAPSDYNLFTKINTELSVKLPKAYR